jgi:very-short-patch-repair endonuclease
VTSPTRTLIDLCARLDDKERAKAVREGIRLRVFTALEVRLTAARYRGRRGTRGLGEMAARLEKLPIARTRSDAEARALEVLDAAGLAAPRVNVRYAGEEADLSWGALREIIEIDGPQFHQDALEDARKERLWRADGWAVTRVSSDVVFDDPAAFVALVRARTFTDRPPAGGG